ncbi:MAG: ABC transporter permease [Acidimicrobiia bacterium]|nr:ABC transporter permease [Acidimicrobiia bacterium]
MPAIPTEALPVPMMVSERPGPIRRVRNVWRYRELLRNLVRRELKVRYKGSILGFVWTLLNPLMYLVVFSVVFSEILRVQVPDYGIFFLSGLLAWNFFSGGLGAATGSIVDNAPLVTKVWFPREVLPLAAIGSNIVNFLFQASVLIAGMAVLGHAPGWRFIPALLLAIVVLLVLTTALGLALSAAYVYLRDTKYLVELGLLAWFWMSAVVYPYNQVAERLGERSSLLLLNPMIPVITAFQRVFYNPPADLQPAILPPDAGLGWYLRNLTIVGVGSVALLIGASYLFGRLEDNLGEEI